MKQQQAGAKAEPGITEAEETGSEAEGLGEGQGEGEQLDADGAGAGTGAEGEGKGPGEGEGGEVEVEEVVVAIGDEEPPPEEDDEHRAPAWVKELRRNQRETVRKLREVEAENARLKGTGGGQQSGAAVVVGEKPTLEGCDFDGEKFAEQLEAWHTRKAQAEEQTRQVQQAEQQARSAWQLKLNAYGKGKGELKVKDFEDAEAMALDVLSVTQQGVIVKGAKNPALVIYALGKNPAKAKQLAAITDPVEFAFAAAELEQKLKVTPRKTAPAPERQISSSVPGAASVDNQLEKLRAEAARTGDNSKVVAFRRQQQAKVNA